MYIKGLLILLFFITASFCGAQESVQNPFSTIGINASFNRSISIEDLDEFWEADYGVSVRFETPFYFSHVSLGLDYTKFTSKKNLQPDFNSFFLSMMLNRKLDLFSGTNISAGIKFGTFIMLFDDTDATEFESTESELAIGANVKFEAPILKNIRLYLSTDFTTVFTNKRMKLWDASGGIIYTFVTPKWLKDFLE